MNCQSFGIVVVDLARSQPLEVSVRDAALAHGAACESCARLLMEARLLTDGLRSWSTETKSENTPARVQQNLVAAFRRQSFAPQQDRANNRWRYLAIAAAVVVAVVLGALGVGGFKIRQAPGEPQAQVSPPLQLETTPEPPPAPIKQPENTQQVPRTNRRVLAKKHRLTPRPAEMAHSTFVTVVVGSVTDPESPEVASPFMAVGYTNPANLQEGAQVVRVELPRYAMARFGLPVNMERYDERVKADVWLGPDGLARAIRFVQ